MTTFRRQRATALAWIALATISASRCGGSSTPAAPTTSLAMSAVALSASSITIGSTAQGTVSLSTTATSTTSITLTSSNPSVATVQTPVTVQVGASSVAFTVTGMAAGTVTITASLNGSTGQTPALTVTPAAALSSISLSASTVVGGNSVTGTATLTAAAPAGGAVVALSGGDPVTVPPSVTVPAGSATAAFNVSTRLVGGTIPGTVTGSYGGASKSAVLAVTKPTVATASFGVTGPTETDTCTVTNAGNTLNCTFNGTTSTAPGNIVAYEWSYRVAATLTQTTAGPVLTMPAVGCGWLPAPPLPAGAPSWLPLTVTLKVRDDQGNVSAVAINDGARVFPQGVCGY
jgi:hypothetical protein